MKTKASNKVVNEVVVCNTNSPSVRHSTGLLAGFVLALVSAGPALAGPTGGEVVGGEGTISQTDALTQIDQFSNRVSINWETFNVAANETVRFVQPTSSSVALNTIFDQNPSQIFGTIDANGRVLLINPNGMIFGATAQVNVAGLVASSLRLSTADFMAGNYNFEAMGSGGMVLNQGSLQAAPGGFIALLGEAVSNEGLIVADAGTIAMGSGTKVALDFDGSGLLYFEVESEILDTALGVDAAVSNSGSLFADGGQVLLTAKAAQDVFTRAINNDGLIQARRIENAGGVVRLTGGDGTVVNSGAIDASGGDAGSNGGTVEMLGGRVGVLGSGSIDASGDTGGGSVHLGGAAHGAGELTAEFTQVGNDASISADGRVNGDGGEIVVWADDSTWFNGSASVTGGAEGGDGGFVEISGAQGLSYGGFVDATAQNGELGTLLFDPTNINIINGSGGAQDGPPFPDLDNNPPTAGDFEISEVALETQAQTANIDLVATNDITVADLTTDGVLNLARGNGGTVSFDAGNAFAMANTANTVSTGGGDLTINATTVTAGNIDTSGPADADGGDVGITASSTLSVGNISASAGTDSDNSGQAGGTVTLSGSTVNVGAIVSTGSVADGGTSSDGAGGAVDITATDGVTPVINVGGNINTAGGNNAAGGSVTFNDPVVLTATTSIDTGAGAGDITFGDTLDGTAALTEGLTLTAGTGAVAFNGAVGGSTALGDVAVTSAASVDVNAAFRAGSLTSSSGTFDSAGFTIDTSGGADDDGGAVDITATGTLVAGAIDASAGTDSDNSGQAGGAVTLSGSTVATAAITSTGSVAGGGTSSDGAGGAVDITATDGVTPVINVGGNINTAGGNSAAGGSVTFNDPVVLTATTSIDTGAGAGDVTFSDTVDGTADLTEGLTLTAGTGAVAFNGAVGGSVPLGDVAVTSAGSVDVNAALRVASLTSSSGTFDSAGFTIDTTGGADADGGVVDVTATGTLVAGAIDASAGTDSDNSGQAGGAVTLSGSTVATAAITSTGSVNGGSSADGAGGAVTITATDGTTPVITVGGNINTAGGNSVAGGSVSFNDPVVLAGTTSIDTGAGAGDITFGDTVNGTTALTEGLTLAAGTGAVAFNGAAGGSTPLGDVAINSATSVDVNAAFRAGSLTSSSGTFDSAGFTIDTSGGTDDDGGAVDVTATGTLVAGSIDASAGADTDTSGQNGGAVTLVGSTVSVGGVDTSGSVAGGGSGDGAGGAIAMTSTDGTPQITLNGDINSAGGGNSPGGLVDFNDPVVLAQDVQIDTGSGSGDVAFDEGVSGAQALTVTAGSGQIDFTGTTSVASVDASTTGTLTVGNMTTTAGMSLEGGTVDIIGNSTLNSTNTDITIIADTLTDGAGGVINAGTGTLTLTSQTTDAAHTIGVCSEANANGCTPGVRSTEFDLTSYGTITASRVQVGTADHAGDIYLEGGVFGGYELALVNGSAGSITVTTADSTVNGLDIDSGTGGINLDANLTTSNDDVIFRDTVDVVSGVRTIDTDTGAGAVDFQAGLEGAGALVVTAGTGNVDLQGVGQEGTPLGGLDVTTSGQINLNGNITTDGDIALNGTVRLQGNDVTVDSNDGGAGGNIGLADASGSVEGPGSLEIVAGAGTVTLGPVGQATALSDLTVSSAAQLNLFGNIETDGANGMSFTADAVSVGNPDAPVNPVTLFSNNADIDFITDDFRTYDASIINAGTGAVSLSPTNNTAEIEVCDDSLGSCVAADPVVSYDVGGLANVTQFQIGNAGHTGDITLTQAQPDFDLGLRNGGTGGISVAGAFDGQGLTITSGSGGIALNADVSTNGNDAVFVGDVSLGASVTVDSSGIQDGVADDGNVDFQGTINGNQALIVDADGSGGVGGAVNLGDVGQGTALSSLTVTAATVNLGGDIRTSGNIALSGAKNLSADVTLDTGTGAGAVDIATGSTSDEGNGYDLVVTAGDGQINLGETTVASLGASTTATLNVGGDITTNGVNAGSGYGIDLAGDTVTLDTSNNADPAAAYDLNSNNQPIRILANTLNDSNGTDINAGTSTVTLAPLTAANSVDVCNQDTANGCGSAADTQYDLASYAITAGGVQVGGSAHTGDISMAATTLGAGQTYDLSLENSGAGTITVAGDFNGQGLSVDAGTGINLDGNVTTNNNNVTFADDVTLGNDVAVATGDGNADFQGAVNGAQSLTVSATGGDVNIGAVGQSEALTALSVTSATGTIDMGGNISTSGAVTLSGAKNLTADVTIDTSSGDGAVAMSTGAVSNAANEDLSIVSGAGNVTLGGVSVDALTVTTSGNATLGQVTNTGNIGVEAATITANGSMSGANVDLAAAALSDLNLPQITATGSLTVGAGGNVIGASELDVTGPATVTSGGNVTLTNANNNFGSIGFTANSATLIEEDATNLSGADIAGGLTVTSGGNITDSGSLSVGGTAQLTADGGNVDIVLDNAGNTFGSLVLTADNADVTESDATNLGASNIGTNLSIDSGGDITDSGQLQVGGQASLTTSSAIVLDQATSTFGSLALDAGSADVSESGDMSVASAAIDTSLSLQATGAIAGTSLQASTLDATAANGINVDSQVDSISLANSTSEGIVVSNTGDLNIVQVSQNAAGGVVDISTVADASITQSGDITANGGSVTVTANGGALTMAETAETTSNGGDITYRTTGANGGDITLGLLKTCEDCNVAGSSGAILIEAIGDILGQPRVGDGAHVTGVTAFLISGGQIGSDPSLPGGQLIVFDKMAQNSDANPDDSESAPIHLQAPGDSFVNTNFFLVTSSGRVFNQSEGDRATAASAQAAAVNEEEEVDWAAYSEDITIYEINNEGVQLPDAGEVDEFVMIEIEDGGVRLPGASSDDD